MKEAVGERGDRAQLLRVHTPPNTPAQRGEGVLAEVVPVVPVDALEQQPKLECLELQLLRCGAGPRRIRGRVYWYSHTRISERSWSVSTGFVM